MNKIEKARKVIRDAFKKDPHFRFVYEANIAMLIYDDQYQDAMSPLHQITDLKTKDGCNNIANRVIDLVFGK